MTLAFENFMKQYKMTGREKADGYSQDVFVGLDDHEKKAVFELLVTELPFSTKWLFFIDPKKALDVAKQKEERLRGNAYEHVYNLQEQLVKYSGDLRFQKHMIEDYPNYIERLKPRVVDSVSRTPANDATREFFKQVILVEVNSDAVARASQHLLDSLGVPNELEHEREKYNRLISALSGDSLQAKKRALSELRHYGGGSV